ncbi:MAG: hypothetical protein LBI67_08220, partial [Treponema sp.]|nr:hypothetical protein [Treponema sp.]
HGGAAVTDGGTPVPGGTAAFTGQDLTALPRTYTVTAADGSTQAYTLTAVTVAYGKAELLGDIAAAPAGGTVTLPDEADISLDGTITITKNITVQTEPGGTATITQTANNSAIFEVMAVGATLTLDGNGGTLILDGNKGTGIASQYGLVTVGGATSFIMKSGVTIQNNRSADNGGGVWLFGGTFTMDGGTITGNEGDYGGGVYLSGIGSTFTMNGGTITGNTAVHGGGGVYNAGNTFNMNGGTITGNTALMGAGGVHNNSGTVTGTGTAISGNTPNDKNW